MAKQAIGIGTVANDGTGDTLRDAFDKVNDNFTEVYDGLPVPLRASARYYPILQSARVGTNTTTNGVIKFTPFRLYQSVTITKLWTRLVTASSGQNLQLAIYAADPATGMPTGAALASTGNISTTTAGAIEGAVTQAVIPAGSYFFAVNASDGTAAIWGLNTDNPYALWLTGSDTLAKAAGGGNSVASLSYSFTQTFGTWPDMTSNTTTTSAATVVSNPFGGYLTA